MSWGEGDAGRDGNPVGGPGGHPVRQHWWRRGVPLGSIVGIKISAEPSYFAGVVLITALFTPAMRRWYGVGFEQGRGFLPILLAAAIAILFGISVLIHELGHCLVALRFGIPARQVRLHLIGGVSELSRAPETAKQEGWIAAAGPLASALLAGLAFLVMQGVARGSALGILAFGCAAGNGVIAIFNILPALPLDGGRVLRALVWRMTGRFEWGSRAGVIGAFVLTTALVVVAITFLARGASAVALLYGILAGFVGAGAVAEWPRARKAELGTWPPGMTLFALMRPATSAMGADEVFRPEMIVLPGEPPERAVTRLRALSLPYLRLIGEDGQLLGVVMAGDIEEAMGQHR